MSFLLDSVVVSKPLKAFPCYAWLASLTFSGRIPPKGVPSLIKFLVFREQPRRVLECQERGTETAFLVKKSERKEMIIVSGRCT
jgi:hypothetical protein